jgi:hypothetical protein
MAEILVSAGTRSRDYALECVQRIHNLKRLDVVKMRRVYRPFWYGVVRYSARTGKAQAQEGHVICLGDARMSRFGTIGAYPYRLENPFDLREHGVNFMIVPAEPEADSEVLEPTRESGDVGTLFKLQYLVKSMRKNMRISNIRFDQDVEYHLIYRPYWEVTFMSRSGKEEQESLICVDEVLLTGKN